MSESLKNASLQTYSSGTVMCIECGEDFLEITDFLRHYKTHHQTNKICVGARDVAGQSQTPSRVVLGDGNTGETSVLQEANCDVMSHVELTERELDRGQSERPHEKLDLPSNMDNSEKKVDINPKRFECHLCGKSYLKALYRRRHMKIHSGKRYKCDLCDKVYTDTYTLKVHRKNVHEEVKHQCQQCGKCFNWRHTLATHVKKKHDEKEIQCNLGDKSLKDSRSLNNCEPKFTDRSSPLLESAHTGIRPHKCDTCGKAFEQWVDLKVHHLVSHTDQKPFMFKDEKDPEAHNTDTQLSELQLHQQRRHKSDNMSGKSLASLSSYDANMQVHNEKHDEKLARRHKCTQCGISFIWLSSKMAHMQIHKKKLQKRTGDGHWQCDTCNNVFKSVTYLALHIRREHTNEVRYECYKCGKSFARLFDLKKHKESHGEKQYQCEECGGRFKCLRYLNEHITRTHSKERPLKCGECGRRFSQNAQLVRHSRIHLEKPFQCNECGKMFVTRYTLNMHMRIHNNEKPYKCEDCGRCFTQYNTMKRHSLIHSRREPLKCDECGGVFICLRSLGRHQKQKHKNSYFCSFCGKSFTLLQNLTSHHAEMHSTTFQCDKCGKAFKARHVLERHVSFCI